MSRGKNKAILIGHLGQDPKINYTQNGIPVANFTIATTEKYTNQQGEVVEETEWHNIVAWRKLAEIAEKYLRKGSHVYLEGKLKTKKYTGNDNIERWKTEIEVGEVLMLDTKKDNQGAYQSQPNTGYAPQQPNTGYSPPANPGLPQQTGFVPDEITDDDIPF